MGSRPEAGSKLGRPLICHHLIWVLDCYSRNTLHINKELEEKWKTHKASTFLPKKNTEEERMSATWELEGDY